MLVSAWEIALLCPCRLPGSLSALGRRHEESEQVLEMKNQQIHQQERRALELKAGESPVTRRPS